MGGMIGRWTDGLRRGRAVRVVGALGLAGATTLPLLAVTLVCLAAGAAAMAADASPSAAKRLLDGARDDIDADRPAAARERLGEAVVILGELAASEKPPAALKGLLDRARALREDLELQGGDVSSIVVPDMPRRGAAKDRDASDRGPQPESSAGDPGERKPGTGRSTPKARPPAAAKNGPKGKPAPTAAATVSYSEKIAPLLVRHCGGCHVSGRRGEFQFTSYDTLLKSGMIQKGSGADSRLVEVIRTGDMPRGGGKVPPEDLAALVAWIDEGAVCDTDPAAALGNPAAPAVSIPSGPVALEPGDVSFAFDVAPVLVANCVGCHDAMQPDGNLSMVSLASLVRGGRNGAPVVAGEGATSLLVRKLRGKDIDGQRMPLGKPELSEEVVAKIERWIDQGLKLDLLSAAAPLQSVAAAGRARSLSHEDLRTARFDAADGVWRRSIADEEPAVVTRDDLLLVGNLPAERMEALADASAAALADVAGVLGRDRPVVKGGVVLLAFAKPYDYSAFWENVLGAERPKGVTRHAGVTGDVVFGALVAPEVDSPALLTDARAALAEEIAAAAFVSRGAPDWFGRAAGRAVAVKSVPKSALAKSARGEATERLQQLRRPASVVDGTASPVDSSAVGGAFLSAVSAGGSRLGAILDKLDEGTPFDAAFASVYQGAPQPLFEAWLAKERKRSPGR